MLNKELICIVCPMGCRLDVSGNLGVTENFVVSDSLGGLHVVGGKCSKGKKYAFDEITNPVRMVCTTVKIEGGIHPVIPVKTDRAIPDKHKPDVVSAVKNITLISPVKMGHVVISDIFGTGVNIVTERDM